MIDITTLIPQEAKIELYHDEKLKAYTLRPLTLRDEAWLKASFGDKIEVIFKEMQMDKIARVIFRLLVEKADFASIQVDEYNDDGDSVSVKVTGPQRVMEAIRGQGHQVKVLQGLLETMGLSRPVMEELEKDSKVKKKVSPKKKSKRTGEISSTV